MVTSQWLNMAILHLPQQYIYIWIYMVITSTIIWLNIYNSIEVILNSKIIYSGNT